MARSHSALRANLRAGNDCPRLSLDELETSLLSALPGLSREEIVHALDSAGGVDCDIFVHWLYGATLEMGAKEGAGAMFDREKVSPPQPGETQPRSVEEIFRLCDPDGSGVLAAEWQLQLAVNTLGLNPTRQQLLEAARGFVTIDLDALRALVRFFRGAAVGGVPQGSHVDCERVVIRSTKMGLEHGMSPIERTELILRASTEDPEIIFKLCDTEVSGTLDESQTLLALAVEGLYPSPSELQAATKGFGEVTPGVLQALRRYFAVAHCRKGPKVTLTPCCDLGQQLQEQQREERIDHLASRIGSFRDSLQARDTKAALQWVGLGARIGLFDLEALIGLGLDVRRAEVWTDFGGRSSLAHALAFNGSTEALRLALESGSSALSTVCGGGWTPLHAAARSGQQSSVALLLKHDADVGTPAHYGLTPLHLAARGGHEEVAALLLEARASTDSRTVDGLMPIDYANEHGHSGVAYQLCRRP